MTFVVYSPRFGGFGLSDEAMTLLGLDYAQARDIKRDDPDLVRIVRELGSERASSKFASLQIVEVPDDAHWHIAEYDGNEWVAENHRRWDSSGESMEQ